jgi:hypothetical protein
MIGTFSPVACARLAVLAAALLVLPIAARADESKERRYLSSGGAFSISTDDLSARLMTPGKEETSGDTTVIDFSMQHPIVPFIEQRTVEWIRLDKPIDPMTYDAQATALVSGYLDARFGPGKLVVADRGKFRDSAGRLVYAFAAKGMVNQWPAYWQGVVMFFDTGVAFPSELLAQSTQHKFAPTGGVVLPEVVAWAVTVRPEK